MKKNEGEIPSYWVEGSHPAIIDPVVFNLVQEEMDKNRELGKKRRAGQIFSSMVYCGDCKTGIYGSKTWGAGTPYRRRIWQCNEKYRVKGKINCDTPFMTDEELQRAFVLAFNQILCDKNAYIDDCESIIAALTDTSREDFQITQLQERCAGLYSEIEAMVKDNAHRAQSQEDYQEKYGERAAEYENSKEKLSGFEAEKQTKLIRRQKIQNFLDNLRRMDGLMQTFDEAIFKTMTESMTVFSKRDISVIFRDGREVHVNPGK
jgi:hypothetical protein